MKNLILFLLTLGLSAYIGFSDLHQTDTFVTVGALLVAGFIIGWFVTHRAWLFGVLLGIGVPIAEFIAAGRHLMLSGHESGGVKYWPATYNSAVISLVSIVFALIGVYTAVLIRKLFQPKNVS